MVSDASRPVWCTPELWRRFKIRRDAYVDGVYAVNPDAPPAWLAKTAQNASDLMQAALMRHCMYGEPAAWLSADEPQ